MKSQIQNPKRKTHGATVALTAFRNNAEAILRRVGRGERLILTYRGRPVARLEPIRSAELDPDDPIYRLPEIAAKGGGSLSNEEMDRIIYGV